jgi:malyl-CoA/(S)-citramalyl-CoA lyase
MSTSSSVVSTRRSILAVPATSARFFEKAAIGAADAVFIDLEDSVAPESKDLARSEAIRALTTIDWGQKSVGLRTNALDTAWGHRDIIESVPRCPRLDFIVLPRIEQAFDVQPANALVASLERECGRRRPLSLQAMIETPLGLSNIEAIAGNQCARLESIVFGFGDFSISMGTYDAMMGADGEQWTYALARIATACKAHGLSPVDGPYTNYADLDGLRTRAALAARHGFEAKWIIHPSQIPICHEVFTPSSAQVVWARSVLQALEPALASGNGAIGLNGQLLDMAHAKLAAKIVERATLLKSI